MQDTFVNNENENLNRDVGFSFKDFFAILWSKKVIIIAVTLAVALISFIISIATVETTYTGSCKMIINNPEHKVSNETLAKQYIEVLDTNDFFDMVANSKVGTLVEGQEDSRPTIAQKYGVDRNSLKNATTFTVSQDTGSFVISYTCGDVAMAKDVAQVISKNAVEWQAGITIHQIESVNEPVMNRTDWKIKTLIGSLAGLLLGLGSAFVVSFADKRVFKSDDLEKRYGIPNFGDVA